MAIQVDVALSALTRTLMFDPLKDWTRSLWIYAPTTVDYHTAWMADDSTAINMYWASYIYDSADVDPVPLQPVQDIEFQNNAEFEFTQVGISYDGWYHYAASYEASIKTLTTYINAELQNTFVLTDANVDGGIFITANCVEVLGSDLIGGDVGLRLAYDRVWSRTLTRNEIIKEMNAISAISHDRLVSDEPLDSIDDVGSWTISGTLSTVDGPTMPPFMRKQCRIYRFDLKPREEEKA